MQFDLFFSISQTPDEGKFLSENKIWNHFFRQIRAADELGYPRAWVAESHLSSQTQKKHQHPVVPHWQGEVGINTDIFQVSRSVYAMTENLECGSAIMNLMTNGGPIAQAERLATFLSQQQALGDNRKINIGFSAGRFDFMTRAFGVEPRNAFEKKYWRQVKNQIFAEAMEIFLRLLNKEEIASDDISPRYLRAKDFRTQEEWLEAKSLFDSKVELEALPIQKFYEFDVLKIIPQDFSLDLLNLVLGSHDPSLQEEANRILPTKVFNLSITPEDVIQKTHERMAKCYHKNGGEWLRSYMPRTTFVFINNDKNLSPDEQNQAAHEKAKKALSAYWSAMEGTVDPSKVQGACDNALIGNAETITKQIQERFHQEDCLMLWFDFFNNDCDSVIHDMHTFKEMVMPKFDEENWSNRIEFCQR